MISHLSNESISSTPDNSLILNLKYEASICTYQCFIERKSNYRLFPPIKCTEYFVQYCIVKPLGSIGVYTIHVIIHFGSSYLTYFYFIVFHFVGSIYDTDKDFTTYFISVCIYDTDVYFITYFISDSRYWWYRFLFYWKLYFS